jgi:hypothetical protein
MSTVDSASPSFAQQGEIGEIVGRFSAEGGVHVSERTERIQSIQHILASIFASQRALKLLAPEFNWAGLGNLLGDFGELVAIDHYGLKKAPRGSDGYDAITPDGKKVQIKTNYAASQIGFRRSLRVDACCRREQ